MRAVVTRFGDDYWLERDEDGRFPFEFHKAMADGGWLGITMPEEYGGSGLGVTEAAIMMHEVASHGGGMAAASSVHINLFGPHPIVVKGTDEQKRRWVPRLVSGEDQVAFGFTEPDAGLDTTRIKTFAEKVAGGYLVRGQKVWTSTGGLEEQFDRAGELIPHPHQGAGRSQQHGGVTVVTAGVHDTWFHRRIFGFVLFEDWQSVHIGAKSDRFALAEIAADESSDAGFADFGADIFDTE